MSLQVPNMKILILFMKAVKGNLPAHKILLPLSFYQYSPSQEVLSVVTVICNLRKKHVGEFGKTVQLYSTDTGFRFVKGFRGET
jgi:hypothetical protein